VAHAQFAAVDEGVRLGTPAPNFGVVADPGPAGMNAHRLHEFEITVNFAAEQNVLSVRGDVDLLTAPTLRAALAVLVEQPQEVVLDLGLLEFMDAVGLGVIADISARLATSSRRLTIRSAPLQTLWLLDLTELDRIVHLETADPDVARLGSEQLVGDNSLAVELQPADLVGDLVRVGSKENTAVVDAALRRVILLADATVDGADGVSVTLERYGKLATVASSNDTVLRMDHHQYQTGQGPCLAAAAEGHWFHIESLVGENRWPAFVPRAIHEGIASILSTPLMNADRPIGALNIYSNTERVFGAHQQELAALFATQVSEILADAAGAVTDTDMALRIASALRAREIIARAQGILMARQHVTAEDAAASLHRAARTARTTVLDHACAITASANKDTGQHA
jgi:anti-anti-sigma factor